MSAAIELHQHGGDTVELPAMQAVLRDNAVEHLGVVEAIHYHQPIDDLARARR